jgi:prevent-host-death family protein
MTLVMESHPMDSTVSNSKLKAKALEYFRRVEETAEMIVVTDQGRPVLEIVPSAGMSTSVRSREAGPR